MALNSASLYNFEIMEDIEFISIQAYLENELNNVENGNAEYLSIDQLDESLETIIRKHET